MIKQITQIMARSPDHVLADLIGVISIFALVFAGLSIPGLT